MKFSELDLHPSIMAGINKLGYEECTPVQAATMPLIFEGKDIAGLAQTGTGKTAAFLLPLIDRMVRSQLNPAELSEEEKALADKRRFPDWKPNQFILVLVPTRELCEQVYENAVKLKGDANIRSVSIYGGVSYDKQKQGLRDGSQIVVATPGRLIDLYKENLVDMKQVRAIVFDEADRMFDMGFKEDMKYILQRVPKERQFLVFSATLNLDVLNVAYQFGANPVEVNVSRDQAKAENVDDKILHIGQEEKPAYLLSVLRKLKPRQTIVFSNFKMNVPRITQFLNDNQVPAVGISSLLTQSQRTRVMEQFKSSNDQNILVATDVAARGLDIKGVDLVINFELPDDAENYVHRIGRTGRAGEKGLAFSLVSDRDVDALQRIEEYLEHKVGIEHFEDTEIVKDHKPFPSEREMRGNSGGGPRGDSRGGGGRGGDRPQRDGGGRGGRRDGGRRDGGGRGDHRGPRPGGEPRAAGGSEQRGGEHRGPRRPEGAPGAASNSGASRPQARGPREPGAGPNAPRGPRRDGRPQQGNGRGFRGPSPGGAGGDSQQQSRRSEGRGPSNYQRKGASHPGPRPKGASGPTPASASLSKKVSGFFKRLFGS